MTYAQMLDKMISASALSLRQLSKRCDALGVKATPSYLSQLKNGKLPPPAEHISSAIAKACDPHKESLLIFQGYLEKAPEVIREYMIASSELNKTLLESLSSVEGSMTEEFRRMIGGLDIVSALDLAARYTSRETETSAKDLVKEITLAAGGAAATGEGTGMRHFYLADNAMSPLIPQHCHIFILPTKKDLLKDRDIIAFSMHGSRILTIRRVFFVPGKIILTAEDRSASPIMIDSLDAIEYAGKVVSYRVDL